MALYSYGLYSYGLYRYDMAASMAHHDKELADAQGSLELLEARKRARKRAAGELERHLFSYAYIVMAYIVMALLVMALYSYGLNSHGPT